MAKVPEVTVAFKALDEGLNQHIEDIESDINGMFGSTEERASVWNQTLQDSFEETADKASEVADNMNNGGDGWGSIAEDVAKIAASWAIVYKEIELIIGIYADMVVAYDEVSGGHSQLLSELTDITSETGELQTAWKEMMAEFGEGFELLTPIVEGFESLLIGSINKVKEFMETWKWMWETTAITAQGGPTHITEEEQARLDDINERNGGNRHMTPENREYFQKQAEEQARLQAQADEINNVINNPQRGHKDAAKWTEEAMREAEYGSEREAFANNFFNETRGDDPLQFDDAVSRARRDAIREVDGGQSLWDAHDDSKMDNKDFEAHTGLDAKTLEEKESTAGKFEGLQDTFKRIQSSRFSGGDPAEQTAESTGWIKDWIEEHGDELLDRDGVGSFG